MTQRRSQQQHRHNASRGQSQHRTVEGQSHQGTMEGQSGHSASQEQGEQRSDNGQRQRTPEEMERARQRRRRSIRARRRRRRRLIIGMVLVVAVIVLLIVGWPFIAKKPSIKLIGDSSVTIAQGEEYEDEGATATWYGRNVSDQLYVTDDVDPSKLGTYEVVYNFDGRFRKYSKKRKVTVTDQTAPEITLNGDDIVVVDKFDDYKEPGATAVDNCDGDVSDNISISDVQDVNEYSKEVTYTVTDQAGNEAKVVRSIQLPDDVKPEIALNGEDTMTIDRFSEFDDPGVNATDNREGDISDKVEKSGYVDIYRPDTYEVTYTAKDASGNEASVKRTVVVENAAFPEDEEHTIYLTFDDGPSDDVTVSILDTLKENDIKATFFILDYDEDKLPILQRMIDEGHTIGIHGYSHEYNEIYTSVDDFMNSIDTLAEKLKKDTGYEAFCMRFPGGSSNTVSRNYCQGIMSDLVQVVTDQGWMYFDWNVSSGDASGNNVATDKLIANVENELEPEQENVILMHDTSAKQTSAEALPTIIQYGKDNGYTFKPITKDTPQVHHGVSN